MALPLIFGVAFWTMIRRQIIFAVLWFLKVVVLKLLILGLVFTIVAVMTPLLLKLVGNKLDVQSLNTMFSNVPAAVWYFANIFRLDIGIKLIIAAYTTRFLVRRLPFIG